MKSDILSIHRLASDEAGRGEERVSVPGPNFDSPATRPTVFNREHALSRLGGLEDVLHDVMKLVLTESRSVHAEIDAAYSRRDAVVLKRSAHTLKGAASIVGATDLYDRLKRVEEFASAHEFDRAAAEFPEINRQFDELQSRVAFELGAASVSECS